MTITTLLAATTLHGRDSFAIIFTESSIFNNCQENISTFSLFIASSKFRSSDIQGKMRNEKDGIDWWSFPIPSFKFEKFRSCKYERWNVMYQLSVNACEATREFKLENSLLEIFDFFYKRVSSLAAWSVFTFLFSQWIMSDCQSSGWGGGRLWQKCLDWIYKI